MRTRGLSYAAVAILTIAGTVPLLAQEQQPSRPLPMPRMVVPEARIPIEIRRVDVQAEVAGRQARTRMELELFNANARVLEGELQFPLQPNQVVTGFALDIDGELRSAVPVEKAKGRQVFEDVTRTQVDPSLLESTVGNNYKLRIYPLPANGSRRVVLDIIETLDAASGEHSYRLPLAFPGTVSQLDVLLRVAGVRPKQVKAYLGAVRLDARPAKPSGSEIRLSRRSHENDALLKVDISADRSSSFLTTGDYRGERYFYAEVPAQSAGSAMRARPSAIAILWDASGSAALRDKSREFALLDALFGELAEGPLRVELVVVRNTAEPPRRFTVERGDWRELRGFMDAQVADGATNLGAMRVPPDVDMALLFTDGLGNYGGDSLPSSPVPLYTISTALRADTGLLRSAAERSGAAYLPLAELDIGQALQELRTAHARLVEVRATGAEQLVTESLYPQNGYIQLAGVLKSNTATVRLEWRDGAGRQTTQTVNVSSSIHVGGEDKPLAAMRWAALTLQALEQDRHTNQAAIRRLGTHFGLATAQTSLIVLDTVEDYARFEIEPPSSLLPRYRQLVAQAQKQSAQIKSRHLDHVALRFDERAAWWAKDFPKDEPPPDRGDQDTESAAPAVMAPRPPSDMARRSARPRSIAEVGAAAPEQAAPQESGTAAPDASHTTIRLKKWDLDAPYIQRIRNAATERLYATYLDEKPGYAQSTAFFLDVADALLERGQHELGLRVLSNLAEMNLQDRHILRILAYRLLQVGRVELALPVLERVLALAPDEPQSWRDLALALNAAGHPQQAIEKLWEVVARPWDRRFADIELTALTELNAIVAHMRAEGVEPDLSRIDARLLRHMPLDLRVVLSWDADNTDIDLWVVDPNGEKAYYGKPLTYQGGRMSRDFTGGYGPETFELCKAKPGRYTVKAQFYGHNQQIVAPATTIMLHLSTGYGALEQKDERVTLRLAGEKDEIEVGTFDVK